MTWLQHWTDVLFLHFPVAASELSSRMPPGLEIDTYDGQAWLSYIFFRLKLRPAWLPPVPGLSSLVELNVRTYVRHENESGIYFLRMYADNPLAILASRFLTPLCYEHAAMIDERSSGGSRHIACRPPAVAGGILDLHLEINTHSTEAKPKSLDAWLVERYRAFVAAPGALLTATVTHPPWQISLPTVTKIDHTLGPALGLAIEAQPRRMHYSPGVKAVFQPFRAAHSNAFHAGFGSDGPCNRPPCRPMKTTHMPPR